MKKYVSISFLMLTAFMVQSSLLGMEEDPDDAKPNKLQTVIDSQPRSTLLGAGLITVAAVIGLVKIAPAVPPVLRRIGGALYYGSKHGLFFLLNGSSLEEDTQQLQEKLCANTAVAQALSMQISQLSSNIPTTGVPVYPPAPAPLYSSSAPGPDGIKTS